MDSHFQEFVDAWPKGYRQGISRARMFWNAWFLDTECNESGELLASLIIAKVKEWAKSQQWRQGMVPRMDLWLEQRRWEDEIRPGKPENGRQHLNTMSDDSYEEAKAKALRALKQHRSERG